MASFSLSFKFLSICLPLGLILLANAPTTSGLSCQVGHCGTLRDQPHCSADSFKEMKCPANKNKLCFMIYDNGTRNGQPLENSQKGCIDDIGKNNFDVGFEKNKCIDRTDEVNKRNKEVNRYSMLSIAKVCTCDKDNCNLKDSMGSSSGSTIKLGLIPTIILILLPLYSTMRPN